VEDKNEWLTGTVCDYSWITSRSVTVSTMSNMRGRGCNLILSSSFVQDILIEFSQRADTSRMFNLSRFFFAVVWWIVCAGVSQPRFLPAYYILMFYLPNKTSSFLIPRLRISGVVPSLLYVYIKTPEQLLYVAALCLDGLYCDACRVAIFHSFVVKRWHGVTHTVLCYL
jgi:hypothetical protein